MFLWNLLSENCGELFNGHECEVLILVFVEFTLRAGINLFINKQIQTVLILVFVEFTLRVKYREDVEEFITKS